MKNKAYSVQGDPVGGHRIAVPEHTGVKKGDKYNFIFYDDASFDEVIPAGSLLYVPVAGAKK